MKVRTIFVLLLAGIATANVGAAERGGPLRVSVDGHFLQYADGRPFFWLGDTAWELFHRLDRDEADLYIADRAAKGYTVIQAVALAEMDGLGTPNAYGHLPLVDRDPSRPATRDGEANDYWDHVDYIVGKIGEAGMYVGLLPTWGDKWSDGNPIFDERNAEKYGRFIAERYRDCNVIWILGGDRNPDDARKQAVVRAMARGIRSVDRDNLITFHPAGWRGSAEWFHDEGWLSFNARQNGHTPRYQSYHNTLVDYRRMPAKPVVDIEPLYEDHPLEFRPDDEGHSTAADVRRALYWDVFDGACGVTYGHHSVWQMYDPDKGRAPVNRPLMPWREALDRPAAVQAGYLRRLVESRPYFTRIPAPDFIVPAEVASAVPGGNGRYRMTATMDAEGSYALVYVPCGRAFSVRADMLKAKKIVAWWFCPRTGKAKRAGVFDNDGRPLTFVPPAVGEADDAVLVLDDAARRYSAPGGKAYVGNRK